MTKNICFVTDFESIEASLNTHKYLLKKLSDNFDNVYLLDSNRFKFFKKRNIKKPKHPIKKKNIKEIKINNYKDLKFFFNKKNTVILNNIGRGLGDFRLLFFFRLIKIPQIQVLNTDVVSYERTKEIKFFNIFNFIKFIFKKKIFQKLSVFFSIIGILSKIDICFTTKKYQFNRINKNYFFKENFSYIKKSVLVNSLAYDVFKKQIKNVKQNHILYIDYNVNHEDTVELRGRLSKKDENYHYQKVISILKKLEKLYKKSSSEYSSSVFFKKYKKNLPGFKINKFNTIELIKDAEVVVFFNSTVINYAYLMNKKILNLSSDILGENTKIETNIFPSRSGVVKVDINKEFNYSKKLEKSFKSGQIKNRAFINNYLKPDNKTIGLDKIVREINKNFFY